ncbi:ABC transporter-like protein [Aspergillus saccharolyticus JOP 1030-1]|uniref:ABC transporter-like protein n=1 Tax=Aspergillus saccharolyticus JOP 1030-1 TaxID=1450539 RepID=A0A318ZKQ6_9EURO|nr:ABC transporter-like protein [Aspergillus saccharolyticus JOP 1030-1]PYH48181.1 ABC transporter-like protein [Aspergillus saccharolyticus JOP 1030-1]
MNQCNDDQFGPGITGGCRSNFDFTLLFEQSILSLLPSTILILVFPGRLAHLVRQDIKTAPGIRIYKRVITYVIFAALQITLLAEWASAATPHSRMTIPAASLAVVDALIIMILSVFEYQRSFRPSTILSVYLLFSMMFDAVQLRTIWLLKSHSALSAIATASLATKLFLLVQEAQNKRKVLREPYRSLSPESVAGVLNRSCFLWLNPLLWQGFRALLSAQDVFRVDYDLSSALLKQRFIQNWYTSRSGAHPRLLLSVAQSLQQPILAAAIPRLFQSAFTWCQPFLIFRVISYVNNDEEKNPRYGYGLIGATALIYAGVAFSNAIYKHKTFRMITMIRGGLISLLYDKTLKLNVESITDSAAITLMTTDIDGIATNWVNVHEIWASPLDVGIGIYLLKRKLGVACVAPVALALISTFGSAQIAKMMRGRQGYWLGAVQKRVSLTSSLLTNMRGLKMMAMASFLGQKIRELRSIEIAKAKAYLRIECFMNMCANMSALLSPVITLLIYAFVTMNPGSNQLTSSLVYYTLTIVSLMSSPLGLALNAVPTFLASLACFTRIQKYLLLEEKQDYRDVKPCHQVRTCVVSRTLNSKSPDTEEIELSGRNVGEQMDSPWFSIVDGSFGYYQEGKAVLTDVCWDCHPHSITMVLGPVGSGKTTLLKAIMGEVKCLKGSVVISESAIAYCSQDVWLQDHSLRDNILGGRTFECEFYHRVLHATCLDSEIAKLPHGDQTKLGSKAVRLSGGQSQRVAVARAIYAREPLLLLDDSFSGLDNTSQALVHDRLLGPRGLLRELRCTVVLATHNTRYINYADAVLIVEKDGSTHLEKPSGMRLESDSSSLGNSPHKPGEEIQASRCQPMSENSTQPLSSTSKPLAKDIARQKGDLSIYAYYMKSVGTYNLLVYLLLNCLYVFCTRFGQVWAGFWVNAAEKNPSRNSHVHAVYGGSYVGIMTSAMLLYGAVLFFMFQVIVPRSAQWLHSKLLRAAIQAPYSFHAATDIGSTLNRFSQDITLIDVDLPSAAVEFFLDCFTCLGQAILICTGVRYIAAFLPAVMLATYLIQKLYLRTSRQIRYLDLEAKAPLFSQLLDTYSGLLTIRAHGWEDRFQKENIVLLDESQRPFYALYCIQRWLTFTLSLLVVVVAVVLVTFGTQIKSITSGNAIGTALINVINFAQTLSLLITAYTTLETSIGAVARIKDFVTDVRLEDDLIQDDHNPQLHSPSLGSGRIEFKCTTASYRPMSKPVLDHITFSVEPGMRVAICGRSGSGKSSLILALLKMLPVHHEEGTILIDGMDINTLSSTTVRSLFNTIPQTPVLFPGSIRDNLDPSSVCSDTELRDVLQALDLWTIVTARAGGLNADIETAPLSQGQKQLLCVGRSFLTNGDRRILLLDESTSSLDAETEAVMMRFLTERFGPQHTILAVTHRLNTVSAYDRIAVLEGGQLVEWGEPRSLREREGGYFRSLWEHAQEHRLSPGVLSGPSSE